MVKWLNCDFISRDFALAVIPQRPFSRQLERERRDGEVKRTKKTKENEREVVKEEEEEEEEEKEKEDGETFLSPPAPVPSPTPPSPRAREHRRVAWEVRASLEKVSGVLAKEWTMYEQ
ncbi:hypothetical protein M0804_001863 [Polistes exclamans]|nr:hypothetical protein M0804_001863 [Polistes exclamans]